MAYAKGLLFPFRRGFLIAALGLFVSGPAWAVPPGSVNYNFDFRDSTTYSTNNFVTDFPGWSTTDQWLNNGFLTDTNIPNSLNGRATTYSSGQASFIGGIYGTPTVATSELNFSFNPQGNTRWSFNWVQNLGNSGNDDGIRDTFGWSVLSTGQTPILTLKFTPGSFTGTDNLPYDSSAEVFSGSISSTNNAANGTTQEVLLNRGEWVSFELNMDTIDKTWSISIGSVNDLTNAYLMSGVIDIVEGTAVGGISQFWDVADPLSVGTQILQDGTTVASYTGAGLNVMMVESLSIKGVPEPSSASLVLFSSLALLAARRRRRSHS